VTEVNPQSAGDAPPQIADFAGRAVEYVKRSVGLELTYDSDTLPLLDHYLRSVPTDKPEAIELVALTAGAYFGEVIRRVIGGRWDLTSDTPLEWRMNLPSGLNFAPAGFVIAAIARDEPEDVDAEIDAPPRMRPFVAQALERMGEVTVDEYYSLCGRLDTLEHLHEVLVGVAARLLGDAAAATAGEDGADAAPDADAPAAEDADGVDAPEEPKVN
jgi:hypothetical protein